MTDRTRRRDSTATREALLAAATDLFTTRGFDRTSVRDIAAAADVDQALVFRYFGSKEDLLAAVVSAPGRALLEQVPAPHLLEEVVHRLFDQADDGGNLLLMALTGPTGGRVGELLETEVATPFRAAFAAHSPNPDAHLRAELVLAWVLGIALSRRLHPTGPLADRARAQELALTTMKTLLGGPTGE